jgi:formylmethanofuran dehydrogenase subunit C
LKEIILKPKKLSSIPLEAEVISPDDFARKHLSEIGKLKVNFGNTNQILSDWFKVDGSIAEEPSDQIIKIKGNVPHVKYIGAKMTSGKIIIEGHAGFHTGSQMTGGELEIIGNTGDWSGAEMKGGLLKIKGNAGNLIGAAYRGSSDGMTGGCIHITGNVGAEAASFMRRGLLVIEGNTGPFTGVHMNGGEIIIFGRTGRRAGTQAKGNGGFIACLGGLESMLPTYRYDTTFSPVFWRLYLIQLKEELGISKATEYLDVPLKRYRGDLSIGGTSEILVAETHIS